MNDTRIAIAVGELTADEIGRFVDTFGEIVKGKGPGSGNNFGKSLGVEPVDALRVLAGVSPEWLTDARARVFETIFNYVLGNGAALSPHIWREASALYVTNPRATTQPLRKAALDIVFIERFGLTQGDFEKHVLRASGVISRTRNDTDSENDRLRAYIALGMFGFNDPMVFFRDRSI